MSDEKKKRDHHEECPHSPEFVETVALLANSTARFLHITGLLKKCDFAFVLKSKVCECSHIVVASAEQAREAAEELQEAAKIMESRQTVKQTAPGGSA